MSTRRPRTGGFAASLSSNRYSNVSDKFKGVSGNGKHGFAKRNDSAIDYSERFHASLRASLKVSQFGQEKGGTVGAASKVGRPAPRRAVVAGHKKSTVGSSHKRVYRISREQQAVGRRSSSDSKRRADQFHETISPSRRVNNAIIGTGNRRSGGRSTSMNRPTTSSGGHPSARPASAGRLRRTSHQNGYHHPDSSAAQVAKALDKGEVLYEMQDINDATGRSFARLPSSMPGRRLADFVFLEELGRGAHGVVHKVKSRVDKDVYVIKEIRLSNLKPKRRKNVAQEVLLLRRLHHPNIIQYYTSFVENHALHIVMEFADAGDLYHELRRRRHEERAMSEKKVWHYFSQCCSALWYLHKENIIHRDIKSMNVFLTKAGEVKLGDLGVSRLVDEDHAAQMSRVGTPMYFAPELVKRESYDFKVDAWALGCLVYTMMRLRAPFEGGNIYTLAVDIVKKSPKPLPKNYSRTLRDIVFRMLEKDPKRRPSITDVIKMFPHSVRAKMGEDVERIVDVSTTTSTVSTGLTRTRSSSRTSLKGGTTGGSFKGGGKVVQNKDPENVLAWKTVEETTMIDDKRDSPRAGTSVGRKPPLPTRKRYDEGRRRAEERSESSTMSRNVVPDTTMGGRGLDQSTINLSTEVSSAAGGKTSEGFGGTVRSTQAKGSVSMTSNTTFKSTANSSSDAGRGDRENIVNPERFFEGAQRILRRQNRPFSAGRIRDRRVGGHGVGNRVGASSRNARRARPQSAGHTRHRSGYGSKKEEPVQFGGFRHNRLRPKSAGAVRGNRHRWNAQTPQAAVPSNAKVIVVKQFRSRTG